MKSQKFTLWCCSLFCGICFSGRVALGDRNPSNSQSPQGALLVPALISITKPFLYRADKGSGVPIYILGTKEIGITLEQFPKCVVDKFDRSDVLANSLGLRSPIGGDVGSEEFWSHLNWIQWNPNAPGLVTQLGREAWNRFDEIADQNPGLIRANRWALWYASYATEIALTKLDESGPRLSAQLNVRKLTRKVHRLSEGGFISYLKNRTSIDDFRKFLLLKTPQEWAAFFQERERHDVAAYLAGEENYFIAEADREEPLDVHHLLRAHLLNETASWYRSIENLRASALTSLFIFVPVEYVVGEWGLVQLLEKQGYTVRRVEAGKCF